MTLLSTEERIGLTLSGGGFRATLFHLGVIRLLRSAGLLHGVKRINAVSGGSILAAHLVLNWERYTGTPAEFEAATKEVVKFTRRDVRGRVIRRWLFAWLLIVLRPLRRRRWTFTKLLQREYARFYKHATLKSLYPPDGSKRPEVFLYCASLSTGSAYWFGRSGLFTWHEQFGERHVRAEKVPIALAVAASSAFPPLFPPIALSNDDLGCDDKEFADKFSSYSHYLTDGGVYDNLGIDGLLQYQKKRNDLDRLIVSDAEGNFDWDFKRKFGFIGTRNIRASDILMKRVSALEYRSLDEHVGKCTRIDIDVELSDRSATKVSLDEQRDCRNTRTDLDVFSKDEIDRLIQHGYAVARAAVQVSGLPIPPSGSACEWQRLSRPDGWLARKLRARSARGTGKHRVRLWSVWDWVSWANGLVIMSMLVGVAYYGWVVPSMRANVLQTQNRNLKSTGYETFTYNGGSDTDAPHR